MEGVRLEGETQEFGCRLSNTQEAISSDIIYSPGLGSSAFQIASCNPGRAEKKSPS